MAGGAEADWQRSHACELNNDVQANSYFEENYDTASYPQVHGRRGWNTGAALVEFTIFAPMLVVMSIYTMDFGLLFFNKIEVQNAAQAGAQWAIANRVFNSTAIQVAAQNATNYYGSQCLSNAVLWLLGRLNGNVTVTPLTVGSCNSGSACTASSSCTLGVVGNYVTVTVTPTTAYNSFVSYGFFSTSPSTVHRRRCASNETKTNTQ